MTTTTTNDDAPMTHSEALDLICKACTVTILSYDEAIAIYLRARGFLRDGSPVMGAPVPDDWAPEPVVKAVERIMRMRGAYDEVTGDRDARAIAIHAAIAVEYTLHKDRREGLSPIDVVGEIAAERQRQIEDECFTHAMDDCYTEGELSAAASAYAFRARCDMAKQLDHISIPHLWPSDWLREWWKPTSARRNLVKAAAMIVAEIERIDRAAAKSGAPDA